MTIAPVPARADPAAAAGFKRHRRGTHRLVPPDVTWRRVEPLLRSFGITRVADVTGLDEVGIPVFQAIRPEGHTLAVSQGKGLTPELARVSAVMEAIELWHAERVQPATIRGPARKLGPLGYALDQLELERRSIVSSELVLDWLEGTFMPSGRPALVPRGCVRMSGIVKRRWAPPTFAGGSMGLAAGNSTAEAGLHALCELVECDRLVASAAVPPEARPHVDLATVEQPDCAALLELFEAASNRVEVIDLTGDFGVPCYRAIISSRTLPMPVDGAGCHPDPAVALARALTEAAQSRLTIIAGARDDMPTSIYDAQRNLALTDLRPRPAAISVPFRARSAATDSVEDDLNWLAARLCDRTGVEPIIVDLTGGRGVPVVKIVAPGMRAPWEGLAIWGEH